MNNIHMKQLEQTLTSMEVAGMVGKRHCDLMRDINRYCKQINEANNGLVSERKIALADFFRESTYKDEQGKERPCYDITKKGCEFIAHKLTGVKGTAFTAQYINRFHDMEQALKNPQAFQPTLYDGAILSGCGYFPHTFIFSGSARSGHQSGFASSLFNESSSTPVA